MHAARKHALHPFPRRGCLSLVFTFYSCPARGWLLPGPFRPRAVLRPILSRKQDAPLLISPYFRYAMSCGSRALEPSVRLQPLMGALEIGFTHRHFHRSMSHLGHPSTGLRIETSSALTDPTSEALAMPEPLPSDLVGGPTLFPICQNQRSPKTAQMKTDKEDPWRSGQRRVA